MFRSRLRLHAGPAAALLISSLALPAAAGQVRINVSSFAFTPQNATLNQGDQVVWVWTGGAHNLQSGTPCTPSVGFSAGSTLGQTALRFSWKSGLAATVPYFCTPHCMTQSMTGSLNISLAGVLVSDFRITEVAYTADHSGDFIEIANLGGAAGNLGQYRVDVEPAGSTITLPLQDIVVPTGGRVVLHLHVTGSNSPTDMYFPTDSLGTQGSVALYLPNTWSISLADPKMIVDFIQWGAAGQTNEGTAQQAGFWTVGEFVDGPQFGHAMAYCGPFPGHGKAAWSNVNTPTPGAVPDCADPVNPTTWGRLKTLYR